MSKIDSTAPRLLPPISSNRASKFWTKVMVASNPDECWPWHGCIENGYGLFSIGKGRPYKAHRVAFFLKNGFDPAPLCVCHSCDNRICCNWNHFFLGTKGENIRDAVQKGRMAWGKRNGHYTSPESTPKGEQSSLAKLTAKQVVEIRKRLNNGERITQVASSFGLHRHTIQCIKYRKTWKHM